MESAQKEAVDGREDIPNPAGHTTTTQTQAKTYGHHPGTSPHHPPLPPSKSLFTRLHCDDWSPRPLTLSSSSLWGGCGIKGERRPWWSALHACNASMVMDRRWWLPCPFQTAVGLEIRHCGASIQCPKCRVVCW
ncbi:hypothetical protein BDA96_05G133400 [Sorghum bicolor]|uniref:Uncharacterized protein n=2 Tax=Sorghum bicolor TaxID=4558 RepID=A0A921UFM2_SORBI|nr:hypothetical protein BDA96_05G133400 [Sorghum bicolor]OQU83465.1 hypothetical protein SORBI_3005G120466 [Sorghum bicolor]